MDAKQFLAEFGHIASAPGGLERTRELILFLASTGLLTTHLATDTPVSEIAESAFQNRNRFIRENQRRSLRKPITNIDQSAMNIPASWSYMFTGDLVDLINGRAFKESEWSTVGLPIIRIQNLNNKDAAFNYFNGEADERHIVENGEMLLSWSGTPGTSFGAFIWNGPRAVLNQHIFKVQIYTDKVIKKYLKLVINASLASLIASARGGVGLKHVTKGQIESMRLPIAPLEEQRRMVAKVDELMALCDKLEAQQQELRVLGESVRTATLYPLIAVRELSKLRQAWLRVRNNLSSLITTGDDVGELRRTVLTLAVTGKLSAKSNSLAIEYMADLVPGFKPAEVPDDLSGLIPRNWCWARFGQVADIRSNLTSPSLHRELPHIAPNNIEKDTGKLLHYRTVAEDGVISSNHHFYPGQILYSKIRPNLNKLCVIDFEGLCSADMYPIEARIETEFLRLVMLSSIFVKQTTDEANRVAMPKINQITLNRIIVPVPPIEEQRSIIIKLSEIQAILDKLEQQHSDAGKVAGLAALAAVAQITGIRIEAKEKMKGPKTELVSSLRLGTSPTNKEQAPLTTILVRNRGELSARMLWNISGLEIDDFYQQLKTEMAKGWIVQPEVAYMKEVEAS